MLNTIVSRLKFAKDQDERYGDGRSLQELQEECNECLKDIKEKYEFENYATAQKFVVLVYKDIIDNSIIETTITKKH